MKKLAFLALCALMLTGSIAYAEVYQVKDQIAMDKEKPAGGKGVMHCKYSFVRDNAPAGDAIKEVAMLTLEPGAVIGVHKHAANEETYVIISGSGTYTDSDGKTYPVTAGDITVVRTGGTHGLANTGTEPLVFAAVIAAQK